MDRLTTKIEDKYFSRHERLSNGEFAGDLACINKLGELEDLEEQGLLLKLPCNIGSTLYDITEFVEGYEHPEIYVIDASKIEISKDEKGILYCIDGVELRDKHFGTILFESMEAAEQAFRQIQEENNNE